MVADSGNGHDPGLRFEGFRAYADATPRGLEETDATHLPARFAGFHSYADDPDLDGDAGDPAYAPAEAELERDRGWQIGRFVAAAGVAFAVAGGFWLGRVVPDGKPERAPVAAKVALPNGTAATALPAQMEVELAEVAPPAPPPMTGPRLEVLPPDLASRRLTSPPPTGRATDTAAAAAENSPPAASASAQPETLTIRPPASGGPRAVAPPRDPPPAAAPAAVPRDFADASTQTSYNCRNAPTRARAMVCADPRLAALDQQMRRAYDAALAAGVSEADLSADQAD